MDAEGPARPAGPFSPSARPSAARDGDLCEDRRAALDELLEGLLRRKGYDLLLAPGSGAAACEVLLATPAVRNLVLAGSH